MDLLIEKFQKLSGGSEILDSIVDDAASRLVSKINNGGVEEQLRFLRNEAAMSDEEIISAINIGFKQ